VWLLKDTPRHSRGDLDRVRCYMYAALLLCARFHLNKQKKGCTGAQVSRLNITDLLLQVSEEFTW
jgi:hypothetical protein